MWEYNYGPSPDELYHHGVKGMRLGVRKKYRDSSGNLNKLGQARKAYEDAKHNRKKAYKQLSKDARGFGIKAIERGSKSRGVYQKAEIDEISAKAKYKAAKAKTDAKAKKAEFNTYRREMQKTGLKGSASDEGSGGRSTRIYNKIKAEKGKAYADKVNQKVQNRIVADIVGSAVVGIGATFVSAYLQQKYS